MRTKSSCQLFYVFIEFLDITKCYVYISISNAHHIYDGVSHVEKLHTVIRSNLEHSFHTHMNITGKVRKKQITNINQMAKNK